MSPVSPSASSNARTCASAFWPVLASSTSSVSCGAVGIGLADHPLHLADLVHQVAAASAAARRCRRARRRCRAPSPPRSRRTSPPPGRRPACAITATSLRSPQTASCSRAAARNVSPAASSTDKPCACRSSRELADRRRLARAVDAGQHDDERPRPRRSTSGFSSGRSRSTSAVLQQRLGIVGVAPTRFHRARRSSRRCAVASTPHVAPEERRSRVLPALRRRACGADSAPPSAPASFSRERASPPCSRSAQGVSFPGRRRACV